MKVGIRARRGEGSLLSRNDSGFPRAGIAGGRRDFDVRRDFAHAPLPERSPLACPMPKGVPPNEIGVVDTSETASEPRELLAMSLSTQPLRCQCQCHVTRANLDPHFVCATLRPKSPFLTRGASEFLRCSTWEIPDDYAIVLKQTIMSPESNH